MPNVKRALISGLRMTAPGDNPPLNTHNPAEDFQNSPPSFATTSTTTKGSLRPLLGTELAERTDHSVQAVARHGAQGSSRYQSGERSRDSQERKNPVESDTLDQRGRRQPPQQQTRAQSTEPRQEVLQPDHAQALPTRAARQLRQTAPQTSSAQARPTRQREFIERPKPDSKPNSQPGSQPGPKPDPRPQKAMPSNGTIQLTPPQQRVADFFDLGDLQQARNESGQIIPGHVTFSGAPDSYSIPQKDLPALLEGLNYERLVQEVRPKDTSLQAPFVYGGNIQKFNLFIVAPALGVDYLFKGFHRWIFRIFTKAIFQAIVVGWDIKKWGRPLFASFRWTPVCKELEKGKPDPEQVVDITVKLSEYERAKKAIGSKLEVHIDVAVDCYTGKLQIIFRTEGVLKASALGVFWQISRIWRRIRNGIPIPGWENVKSFCDIAARVKGEWARKREEALERGRKAVREIELQVDEEVKKLAERIGDYASASDLGVKAEIGMADTEVHTGVAPEFSNVPATGTVAERGIRNGWMITFPMTVRLIKGRGGEDQKMLTVQPAVHAMLKKIGVPTLDIDARNTTLEPAEQEKLIRGACVYAQVFKAVEGAVFANINGTPGTAYAGFFLDMGIVFPIIIGIFPLGTGGATSAGKFKKGAVVPVWVHGVSVQIFGNRDETVATAGIVIR